MIKDVDQFASFGYHAPNPRAIFEVTSGVKVEEDEFVFFNKFYAQLTIERCVNTSRMIHYFDSITLRMIHYFDSIFPKVKL